MREEQPEHELLRVFCDGSGEHGNALGVVRHAPPQAERQAIATRLGYSETIFFEQPDRVRIHTPALELPFAGHPTVGAAWLIEADVLHVPAGALPVRRDGQFASAIADASFAPAWDTLELTDAAAVEALERPPGGHVQAWAWIDEQRVRARVFGEDYGVGEDPATGSAAILLCAQLGRALTIVQGAGSEIFVEPLRDGRYELRGRVLRDA
ncbi:MAG: PhzF family phenazine biosynthesis protein [Solirubrobacteraceae bacterium]